MQKKLIRILARTAWICKFCTWSRKTIQVLITNYPDTWVSYQNTSLFRNLAKYTNIPHVCCPNFDSIPIYLILGVRYTNIPHVFWKFQQYTNIPHAWFGRAKRAYQYTSCFRKMAKYTNIPQFNEYEETITSPLLYRYLPYIICAQCMNNVIWIFLVSTGNFRVKLIEILPAPAVPRYHTLLGSITSRG